MIHDKSMTEKHVSQAYRYLRDIFIRNMYDNNEFEWIEFVENK